MCTKVKVSENDSTKKNQLNLIDAVAPGGCLYPHFKFHGESTVMIGSFIGDLACSYVRDQDYIRIRTDQSDLLLRIVDSDTLIGEGFAKGIYIRVKCPEDNN